MSILNDPLPSPKHTILVQGATGNTGYAILKALLNHPQVFNIRAGVHDESKVDKIQALGPSVEVVHLDTQYPQSVRAALSGVTKLMLCPPNTEDKSEVTKLLIQAAVNTSVKHVVLISVLGADTSAISFQQQFKSLELFLERCGIAFTILRCPTYMDNLYTFSPQLLRGELRLPLGSGSTVMISIDDVGECAAAILTSHESIHENKVYNITGSEPLSGERMAAALSEGFAAPVAYINIPSSEAHSYLLNAGFAPPQAAGFIEIFELLAIGGGEFVSQDSFNLLGRAPIPLSVWARAHHPSIIECAHEIQQVVDQRAHQTPTSNIPPDSINQATNGQGQQTVNQQGQQGAASPFVQQPETPQQPCFTQYRRTTFPHLSGHTERWFSNYYPLHEQRRAREAALHAATASTPPAPIV